MAHAAFGLINSTPHSAVLPEAEMRAMLGGWPALPSASEPSGASGRRRPSCPPRAVTIRLTK